MNSKKSTYGELEDLNLKILIVLSRCTRVFTKENINLLKKLSGV